MELRVNGQHFSYDGDPSVPLLWVLRDELGLTGTKFGCGVALCGACTVHLDGAGDALLRHPMVSDAAGKQIVTIEGLRPDGRPSGAEGVARSSTCRSAATARPGRSCRRRRCSQQNPKPTDEEIDDAMAGNICRCGCYQRIAAAVRLAATGA